MKRLLFFMLPVLLVFGVFQPVSAEPCVEVDVELPAIVGAGPGEFATGYFELTNCGDEAGVVWLALDIDVNGIPFHIGDIPVRMGAGETISREFRMPVPPAAAGYEITVCVTAAIDNAEASDCATMSIEGESGGEAGKQFSFLMASEADCVEVDLELPDTVYAGPGSFAEGYFELINCGDEAATIMLSVTMEINFQMIDTTITVGDIPVKLGAGESISHEFRFPVPPIVPSGEFGICITAVSGEAVSSVCQTVVIVNESWGTSQKNTGQFNLRNYPNPFNMGTVISFELPAPARVNLSIYNILGRQVSVLVDEQLPTGNYDYEWKGLDAQGGVTASGIYLYRLQVDDEIISKKMMIIK